MTTVNRLGCAYERQSSNKTKNDMQLSFSFRLV